MRRHSICTAHQTRLKTLKSTPKIDLTLYASNAVTEKFNNRIKETEFKLVMFIAKHNLPFILSDHMPQYLSSVCYDSEIAKSLRCGHKKDTKICSIMRSEYVELAANDLNNNWCSLL